jgi:hypothetical protein
MHTDVMSSVTWIRVIDARRKLVRRLARHSGMAGEMRMPSAASAHELHPIYVCGCHQRHSSSGLDIAARKLGFVLTNVTFHAQEITTYT